MTINAPAVLAEPDVRRRLRRRPPARVRNGRALLLAIGGYGIVGLVSLLLFGLVGAKGAAAAAPTMAVVAIPIAVVCWAAVRATRTRTKWSLALVLLVSLAVTFATGYLIVMLPNWLTEPNA
ncbi:MAG TPA: hypothetical protein VES02_17270, partial [Dermatophilaceae bacterium]|nr:hypothetical protein [Dermatophilaceae bacterium]